MALITKDITAEAAWSFLHYTNSFSAQLPERFSTRTTTYRFLGIKVYQVREKYQKYEQKPTQ
jgi:hypothetical protein